MRILMRNTVFKTAALAGLFSCLLAFAGVFSGITTSAHATDGFIHADEVGTDQGKLKEFVGAAVDAYYIEFLMKRKCDFTRLEIPQFAIDLIPTLLPGVSLPDLSPASIQMLSTEELKELVGLFGSPSAAQILGGKDIYDACTPLPSPSSFREVFGSEDGDWKSGSIYLFIADDQGNMLYHGADQSVEGERIVAVDEGGRNVRELIVNEAETPMNDGIVEYCWNDPTIDSDDIDDNDPKTAPGDSWKISYVVDPFKSLGLPEPSGSAGVIFGSGIYPKTGTPPQGCDGNGMADGGDGMEPEPVADSVGGGGCAIAAGTDSTPRSNAFNLVLIVSALLFTVSLGNRAMGRRNRISS